MPAYDCVYVLVKAASFTTACHVRKFIVRRLPELSRTKVVRNCNWSYKTFLKSLELENLLICDLLHNRSKYFRILMLPTRTLF